MKTKYFSRAFIESIPEENDEAIIAIALEYSEMFSDIEESPDFDFDFIEVYALLTAFFEAREISITLPPARPPKINSTSFIAHSEKCGPKAYTSAQRT